MTLLITGGSVGLLQKAPYFGRTWGPGGPVPVPRPPRGVKWLDAVPRGVYRASDEVEQEAWLARLDRAADRLELGSDARSRAADLFLSTLPEADRSKRATMAAALYVGCLVAGERRAQGEVAEAAGVSRLTVQGRWKELMEEAGLEPPSW